MEPHTAPFQPPPIPARRMVVTHQGVQTGRYPELAPTGEAQDDATPPDADEWATATELAAEPLHAAMQQWATAGLPVPEVGFELADDKGEVLAEAELAWRKERVAVQHGEQAENAGTFERAGGGRTPRRMMWPSASSVIWRLSGSCSGGSSSMPVDKRRAARYKGHKCSLASCLAVDEGQHVRQRCRVGRGSHAENFRAVGSVQRASANQPEGALLHRHCAPDGRGQRWVQALRQVPSPVRDAGGRARG